MTEWTMLRPDILCRILRYNRGREAQRLAIKYRRMRANPFVFLRGTAHLFYEDLPRHSPLNVAPRVWICGDLHLENFGGYIAADRHEYFDICDFDETALAPVSWELARLCVSLLLAAEAIGMRKSDGESLIGRCLDGYAAGLKGPLPGPLDRRTAQPDLRQFLRRLLAGDRDALLKVRTTGEGSKRRLLILEDKTLAARPIETRMLKRWWKRHRRGPGLERFGDLLDIARRVTGTGSLGVRRYVLLVATAKTAHLLELKEAVPAAMIVQDRAPASPWSSEAKRVVAVQRRAQAVPPRLLAAVEIGKRDFILRELHPGDDKLTLAKGRAQHQRLKRLAPWLGRVAAASHHRTAGWKGGAPATALAAFAKGRAWREEVAGYAMAYKKVVKRDWAAFKMAAKP
jgi:uncharacterized protein (DUF2252 family)